MLAYKAVLTVQAVSRFKSIWHKPIGVRAIGVRIVVSPRYRPFSITFIVFRRSKALASLWWRRCSFKKLFYRLRC